jgi:hypothetical protein
MSREPERGIRILHVSRSMTPEQVAELLAIHRSSLNVCRIPILASHYHGDIIGPLVRKRLLTWEKCEGWSGQWRMPTITDFGVRVLLCVAEDAMMATGRMVDDSGIEYP